MKNSNLKLFIERFDHFCTGIDWEAVAQMDEKALSEEILRVANDSIFTEGRMSIASEMTLELLDIKEMVEQLHDLKAINALSDAERQRLNFYRELAEVFTPLYHHHAIDLTLPPFCLEDGRLDVRNSELCDWLRETPYTHVAGVVVEVMKDVFCRSEWCNTVVQEELSEEFIRNIKYAWPHTSDKDEVKAEKEKKLAVSIEAMLDKLSDVLNHMELGRRMGMDAMEQALYDAFDTFIYDTYYYRQVDAAKELAAWIRQHWPEGERYPSRELCEALLQAFTEITQRNEVQLADKRYTWNIILLDILDVSLLSKEEEEEYDQES